MLVVYAHPDPTSFNHAVLEEFTKGLQDGGHTFEVIDLYAIKFDPIMKNEDFASVFSDPDLPQWILDQFDLKKKIVVLAGGPIKRFLLKIWLRNKDLGDIIKIIRTQTPKDALAQQEKVAKADGIAFISPVWWMNFPTILKGWIERVFTYGFAYSLTEKGWRGDMDGRIPLLKLKKALMIQSAFFKEEDMTNLGIQDAMEKLIDNWGFKYPGVQQVEHHYFYAIYGVDDATRKTYLETAKRLGKEF